MAYSTPELQRVGTAQNLVLGNSIKGADGDNCEAVGSEEYQRLANPLDESEW